MHRLQQYHCIFAFAVSVPAFFRWNGVKNALQCRVQASNVWPTIFVPLQVLSFNINYHQKARMVGERIRDLGSDRTEDVGVAVQHSVIAIYRPAQIETELIATVYHKW